MRLLVPLPPPPETPAHQPRPSKLRVGLLKQCGLRTAFLHEFSRLQASGGSDLVSFSRHLRAAGETCLGTAGAHAEDWRQGHEAELRQLAVVSRGALHSTLGLAERS